MTTPILEVPPVALTYSDRCDRCGAQAFIKIILLTGELLFCVHHFTQHETVLRSATINILDERSKINGKSESSA